MDVSSCSSDSESEHEQNNNEGILYLIQNDSTVTNIEMSLAKPNVDLNYQSIINGDSFLYAAIRKHRGDIVELLIAKGANTTVKIKKKSPLEWVDKLLLKTPDNNHLKTIKKLLENAQLSASSRNRVGTKRKATQQISQNTTSLRNSVNLPSKFIRFDNKYKASGLKLSLHGVIFQTKLLMLFAHRARQKGHSFRLATEMDEAEKFDDIVLEFSNSTEPSAKNYCFVQAKHKNDSDKNKISITNLNSDDDDFSLQKYLISFCKIKKLPFFKHSNSSNFFIVTNTDFDFLENDAKKCNARTEKWQDFFEEEFFDKNDIFSFQNEEFQARKYKLCDNFGGELKKLMKSNLLKSALKSKKINELPAVSEKLDLIAKLIDSPDLLCEARKMLNELLDVESTKGLNKVWKKDVAMMAKKVLRLDGIIFGKRETEFSKVWKALESRKRDTSHDICSQIKEVLEKTGPFLVEIENQLKLLKEKLKKYEKIGSVENHQLEHEKLSEDVNNLREKRKKMFEAFDLVSIAELFQDKTLENKISDETQKLIQNALKTDLGSHADSILKEIKQRLDDELKSALEKIVSETTLIQLALDNTKFDEHLGEFLEKFRIVTNFPNEDKLGALIQSELGIEFNLLNADLAGASFEREMIDFFKRYQEGQADFLTRQMFDDFFVKLKAQIEALMVSGLSRSYPEKLRDFGVDFEVNFEELLEFLSNDNRIFHVITQSTRLGAIKVLRTLDATRDYAQEDSLIFMRLTTLLRKETRKRILSVLSLNKTAHSLIVIEIQNKISVEAKGDALGKLSQFIQKVFINRSRMKIIIIDSMERSFGFNNQRERIEINFRDLDENSRQRVLETEVNFQGRNTRLNQLVDLNSAVDVIDNVSLTKIINQTTVAIGDEKAFSSNGYVKDYYIERDFECPKIKKTVLKEVFELFHIKGADEEDLLKLGVDRDRIEKFNDLISVCSARKSDDKEIIKNIDEERVENVHVLQYHKDTLFWLCSMGNSEKLIKYIDSDDSSNSMVVWKESNIEKLFRNKVMILANDPGMGKSTLLTSIARRIKGIDCERQNLLEDPWIVRINLNDFAIMDSAHSLHRVDFKEDDTEKAIEFVTNMAIPGNPSEDNLAQLQRNLFRIGLEGLKTKDQSAKTPRIVIMFDGFDEISPRLKTNTTHLIKPLIASRVAQLWVTTRVHEKNHLEKELGIPAHVLKPLIRKDQVEFANKFWKWHLKFGKNVAMRANDGRVYENIRKNLSDIKLSDEFYSKKLKNGIEGILNCFLEGNCCDMVDELREEIDKLDFSAFIVELSRQLGESIEIDEDDDDDEDDEDDDDEDDDEDGNEDEDFDDEDSDDDDDDDDDDDEDSDDDDDDNSNYENLQFTKNPLHLRMIAEVVFQMNFQLPKEFGLFNLYDQFIKMKFEKIYYEEKEKIAKGSDATEDSLEDGLALTQKIHQAFAVKLIIDERWMNQKLPNLDELKRFEQEESDRVMKEKQKLARKGVLCLNGDRLEFIHRSFAEYFLSVYLVENIRDDLVQELLISDFLEDKYKLIRQFFNDNLNQKSFKIIELQEGAKNVVKNYPEKSFLHKIAIGNHHMILEFFLKSIQNDHELYETVLTDVFQYTNICDFHEKMVEQLLAATLQLTPEVIKTHVLKDEKCRNILSEPIRKFNFKFIEIILKFVSDNEDKLGKGFLNSFVDCIEIRSALIDSFSVEELKNFNHLMKLFKEFLSSNVFIETLPFHYEMWAHDAKLIEGIIDFVKTDPETLNGFVTKTDAFGQTVLNKISHSIENNERKAILDAFFQQIDDRETIDDLAVLSVYGCARANPSENVDQLLSFELDGVNVDFHQRLIWIKENMFEIAQKQTELNRAIRDKNEEKVLSILVESRNFKKELLLMNDNDGHTAFHVAAEGNQSRIIEILLENLKEHPRILEEVVLKVDKSQWDTALHRAVKHGCHGTIRSFLNYLKVFPKEKLIKKILKKRNGRGMTPLQISYDLGRNPRVKEIFEFVDVDSDVIVNQIGVMGGIEKILKWVDEKEILYLKIEPRQEMRMRLFVAAEKIYQNDASDILRLFIANKDNEMLKKVFFDQNQDGRTLIDISSTVNNYTALDWVVDEFANDFAFFRKFIWKINYSIVTNTTFLSWMQNKLDKKVPGIFKRVLVEPLHSDASLLAAPIHLTSDFYTAKKVMKWAQENCDEQTFEEMLFAVDSRDNNVLHFVAYRWDNPKSQEFYEFVSEILKDCSNLLERLKNTPNEYARTPLSIIEDYENAGGNYRLLA